ncbi:MAG: RecX family transcriptional regulator [Chloroflexi bacterium]|nr:RecX family transcriptional regulator [Chloroflexota bacterium]
MRVTAIEKQRRKNRLNLFLDGRFALGLSTDVAAQVSLRVGDEVDGDRLRALREAEARADAMSAALRLLSYRPRSETELRQRLARRGAPPALVDSTIERLLELGLVDDAAFARSWVESRERASPRGQRLLRQELRAKGVNSDASRELVEGVDDAEAALRASARRAASLSGLPQAEFRRRLGDFLRRRGFDYETIRLTVERRWRELAEGRDDGD